MNITEIFNFTKTLKSEKEYFKLIKDDSVFKTQHIVGSPGKELLKTVIPYDQRNTLIKSRKGVYICEWFDSYYRSDNDLYPEYKMFFGENIKEYCNKNTNDWNVPYYTLSINATDFISFIEKETGYPSDNFKVYLFNDIPYFLEFFGGEYFDQDNCEIIHIGEAVNYMLTLKNVIVNK